MTADLTSLPDAGRFLVTTEHSSYVVDVDARTFTRHRGEAAPYATGCDDTETPYYGLVCDVGFPMQWHAPLGRAGHSTRVVSIDPL